MDIDNDQVIGDPDPASVGKSWLDGELECSD